MLNSLAIRTAVLVQSRMAYRTDLGAATAEYGMTILVAVALALAVFNMVTGGTFDSILGGLITSVLKKATALSK